MDLKAETACLEAKLELPSKQELWPYLEKLAEHPGSAIIIGIEFWAGKLRVGRAWISSTERQALRKAIGRVNATRAKRGETLTSEEEQPREAARDLD